MKGGISAGIATAACAAMLVLPAPALADWTAPLGISGAPSRFPQVAVNSDGDSVFAWARGNGWIRYIQGRTRAADGTLGPLRTISTGSWPDVGIDSSGDATIVWSRGSPVQRVYTRTLAANGTLSTIRALSPHKGLASEAHVAVNERGDEAFVWSWYANSNRRIQGRVRSADGALGPVLNLSASDRSAHDPQVAIDRRGSAVFVWSRSSGRVQSRTLTANGTLRGIQNVSPPGRQGLDPQVAVNPSGQGAMIWSRREENRTRRVQARTRASTGALGNVTTLSPVFRADFPEPQVAVDPTGVATLLWRNSRQLRTRTLAPDGTLGQERSLTPIEIHPFEGRVAVDANGVAVFTWMRFDESAEVLESRTRSASGHLSPVERVSPGTYSAFDPELAVDRDGDATIAWTAIESWEAPPRINASFGP